MPDWIDIGLNLTHESFDDDRGEVIDAALSCGVSRMIVTGTSVTASAKAIELGTSLPGMLYATAGIHPHHASDFDESSLDALSELLENNCAIATGECGLDYFRNFSPRDDQLKAFEAQLELAASKRSPVFLHQRDAHDDMMKLLGRHRSQLVGGVAHCFTGNAEELAAYLNLDLFIGITGWVCDERRGGPLRDAIRTLPLDRLLLETDAPYLLPRDLNPPPKSRRNEPKFLPHITERVAGILGIPTADVAEAATVNTERLFGLPPLETQPEAGRTASRTLSQ